MRTVAPLFSNKNSKSDKIILYEDDKTISAEKELCRTFTTYFSNIVFDLIPNIPEDASDIRSNHDPVLTAINTFQNHPSVVKISKENLTQLLVLRTQIKMKSAKLLKT